MTLRRFVAFCVMVALCAACGDEEKRNNGGVIDGNNGNNGDADMGDMGMADAGDMGYVDEACADVECETGRKCVKGVCVLEDLLVACQDYEDLGEANLGTGFTVEGNTVGWADSLNTSCAANDGFSGAENAFKFTVPEAATAEITLTSDAGLDWLVDVRADSCFDVEAEVVCSDAESAQVFVEPGKEYWIIIEPSVSIDEGAFSLEITFTQLACSPPGGASCDGDNRVVCRGGRFEESVACGTGCTDGICNGDMCSNALEVTASTTFAGDTAAFRDFINMVDSPTCNGGGPDGGIQTPGAEIVFSLPGLTAGQVVTIDAFTGDDNDNGIFITSSCEDPTGDGQLPVFECLASSDIGDQLTWTVDAAGDYFVIIDKLIATDHNYNYGIGIDVQ